MLTSTVYRSCALEFGQTLNLCVFLIKPQGKAMSVCTVAKPRLLRGEGFFGLQLLGS